MPPHYNTLFYLGQMLNCISHIMQCANAFYLANACPQDTSDKFTGKFGIGTNSTVFPHTTPIDKQRDAFKLRLRGMLDQTIEVLRSNGEVDVIWRCHRTLPSKRNFTDVIMHCLIYTFQELVKSSPKFLINTYFKTFLPKFG